MRISDAERWLCGDDAGGDPPASSRGPNEETALLRAVVEALQWSGCLVFRLQAGAVAAGRGGYVRLAPAGTPDLLVVPPQGGVMFIEVKTARGRLRREQRGMHDDLIRRGVPVAVVRSVDDALQAVGVSP